MKREIEGKMTSAVRGLVEKTEAVAKEHSATITVTWLAEMAPTRAKVRTRNATPKSRVHGRGNTNFSEHLEFLIVADVQDTTNKRIIPRI